MKVRTTDPALNGDKAIITLYILNPFMKSSGGNIVTIKNIHDPFNIGVSVQFDMTFENNMFVQFTLADKLDVSNDTRSTQTITPTLPLTLARCLQKGQCRP